MNTHQHPQLTMNVEPHPESVKDDQDLYLVGSLKIAGDFIVDRDINAGAEFTVTIHSADGEVIAQGVCEAKAPKFAVVEMDGRPIGMERCHTVKVSK